MKLIDKEINNKMPPYLIAEISGNHGGSLDRALRLIELASQSGCDAIKFQSFLHNKMTLNIPRDEFIVKDVNSPWNDVHLHSLYKQGEVPFDWYKEFFAEAKKNNITCFSSVFDLESLDALEKCDPPAYKIASCEVGYVQLIEKVAQTKKPIFISTGMATLNEIECAIEILEKNNVNKQNIALFKCTTDYPADPKDSNLKTIKTMKDLFNVEVGLSDHTHGLAAPLLSIAYGASFIEKHFVDLRDEKAIDGSFSMLPNEMKALKIELNNAWKSMGEVKFGPTSNEEINLKYKRSLYFNKSLPAGHIITNDDLICIRPNLGLKPIDKEKIVGKTLSKDAKYGDPTNFDFI